MRSRFGLPVIAPKDRLAARMAAFKERARKRGVRSLDVCVELFISTVMDSRHPLADRMRAAENLCDRFGLPRMSSVENIGEAVTTKLLVTQHFDAPATFNPAPPVIEGQPVAGTESPAPVVPSDIE